MPEYVRHYKHLNGEHYNWRDFKVHLITKKNSSYAKMVMDNIMQILLGRGLRGFALTKMVKKTNNDYSDDNDRWSVVNVLNGTHHRPAKYPKTCTWGIHINGVFSPIDWNVNNIIKERKEVFGDESFRSNN